MLSERVYLSLFPGVFIEEGFTCPSSLVGGGLSGGFNVPDEQQNHSPSRPEF